MPVGGGEAWPGFKPTRRATHQQPSAAGVEGAGGTGGHGRASRSTTPSRRLACGDLAGGRARRRPEHQRSRKQQAQSQIPAAAAVGCGRARRRQGLAGLRDDAPSEARGADGSRAGRRPRARKAARPKQTARRPQHPWGYKQQARIQKRPPRTGWAYLSRLWESNPRPIHYE